MSSSDMWIFTCLFSETDGIEDWFYSEGYTVLSFRDFTDQGRLFLEYKLVPTHLYHQYINY